MIVFLARDIPPFVMYCVNGKPCSSLFIESTDSMMKYEESVWMNVVRRENGRNLVSENKSTRVRPSLKQKICNRLQYNRYSIVGNVGKCACR